VPSSCGVEGGPGSGRPWWAVVNSAVIHDDGRNARTSGPTMVEALQGDPWGDAENRALVPHSLAPPVSTTPSQRIRTRGKKSVHARPGVPRRRRKPTRNRFSCAAGRLWARRSDHRQCQRPPRGRSPAAHALTRRLSATARQGGAGSCSRSVGAHPAAARTSRETPRRCGHDPRQPLTTPRKPNAGAKLVVDCSKRMGRSCKPIQDERQPVEARNNSMSQKANACTRVSVT